MKSLTVYSRRQCHLCDLLLAELVPLVDGRAEIRVVDIDTDPDLQARYWLTIPVVVGGGSELSSYPLDRDVVGAYLVD